MKQRGNHEPPKVGAAEYRAHLDEAAAGAKNLRSSAQARAGKSSSSGTFATLTHFNGDDRPRTKEELAKLFAWWEQEMKVTDSIADGKNSKSKNDQLSDKELVKMALAHGGDQEA